MNISIYQAHSNGGGGTLIDRRLRPRRKIDDEKSKTEMSRRIAAGDIHIGDMDTSAEEEEGRPRARSPYPCRLGVSG